MVSRNDLRLTPSGCRDCLFMRRREEKMPIPPPPGSPPGSMGMTVQELFFCHRFPAMLRTEPGHWCGEWKEKGVVLH